MLSMLSGNTTSTVPALADLSRLWQLLHSRAQSFRLYTLQGLRVSIDMHIIKIHKFVPQQPHSDQHKIKWTLEHPKINTWTYQVVILLGGRMWFVVLWKVRQCDSGAWHLHTRTPCHLMSSPTSFQLYRYRYCTWCKKTASISTIVV